MRRMFIATSVVLLAACSCPKPPVVDGGERMPINGRETEEILSLRSQLADTQEKLRTIEEKKQCPQTPQAVMQPYSSSATVPVASPLVQKTIRVQFLYDNVQFNPTGEQISTLLPLLTNAKRIELRGRTDNKYYSPYDEKIALGRVLSAKQFLINHGVPESKISVNYVSAGDYIAENVSDSGRAQNRRVEIEIFLK